MRRFDYDTMYHDNTGSTETHQAVDEHMEQDVDLALEFEEGFAAASGVRGDTAATGGRIRHPETGDEAQSNLFSHRAPNPADKENAGLADN